MKRLSLAILSVLLISSLAMSGYAQSQSQGGIPDPNAPVPPEKAKAIRHLLEVTGSAKLGQQLMDQLFATRRAITRQVPGSVWDELEKEFRAEFSSGKVIEMVIPIYNRYFTEEEINALIAFYETPVGKKTISVMPQILSESMQVGMQWGAEILKRLEQRLKEKGYSGTTE